MICLPSRRPKRKKTSCRSDLVTGAVDVFLALSFRAIAPVIILFE